MTPDWGSRLARAPRQNDGLSQPFVLGCLTRDCSCCQVTVTVAVMIICDCESRMVNFLLS